MSVERDIVHHGASDDDLDAEETREWLDALLSVIQTDGLERAHYLIERLVDQARRSGANLPYSATTAYINTIPTQQQAVSPGNHEIEHRLRSYIRWNAMIMVVRANQKSTEYGGHISTFASAATLYDVGFNHFFHAATSLSMAETWFFFRGILRRGSTPGPTWRVG
jgi:pyruvate dehydrogenase E1 component